MSDNGKLPDSDLVEVPGGRLEKEAAANWLALRRKGGNELGIWSPRWRAFLVPHVRRTAGLLGPLHVRPGPLAAEPGTSNHGLGGAVDLALPTPMRRVVDGFGAPLGWHWGEVPRENWHVTYRGAVKRGRTTCATTSSGRSSRATGPGRQEVQTWMSDHGLRCQATGTSGRRPREP